MRQSKTDTKARPKTPNQQKQSQDASFLTELFPNTIERRVIVTALIILGSMIAVLATRALIIAG